MKKCPRCSSISSDADISCGVCGGDLSAVASEGLEQLVEKRPVVGEKRVQRGTSATSWRGESLTEFFRHCPGCGRRFHIKLESKKLVTEHRESMPRRRTASAVVARSGSIGYGVSMGPAALTPISVEEGKPIIVDIEEFQYAYKCKHCGHEWSETHLTSRREG